MEKEGNSQFQEIQKQLSIGIDDMRIILPSSSQSPAYRPAVTPLSSITPIPLNVIQQDSELEQKFDKKWNNLYGK